MPQLTLLQVVNSYKNAVEDFLVNDINEDQEAEAIAQVAEEVFYEVLGDYQDWDHKNTLTQLDSVADADRPNYLAIPNNISRIHDSMINYNKRVELDDVNYQEVTYLAPEEFLQYVNGRNNNDSNIIVVEDFKGVKLLVHKNTHPTYFTSFDDKYVIFDSYYSPLETTLQNSMTQVILQEIPDFLQDKDFVIPLPEEFLPTYLNLVKARSSEYLREEPLFTDARLGRIGSMKFKFKNKVGNRPHNKKIKYGRYR